MLANRASAPRRNHSRRFAPFAGETVPPLRTFAALRLRRIPTEGRVAVDRGVRYDAAMSIDWSRFGELVEAGERFVLTSHVRPDADALGSGLALAGWLQRLGKRVRIVNPSATPSTLDFLDPEHVVVKIGEPGTREAIAEADVHVILDTSAWQQIGDVGPLFKAANSKKVVIDHHLSSDDLGAIEFKDTTAEATGSMLFRMGEALGWPLDAAIARHLFCAIATDTGWFRFPSVSSDTYRQVAALIDAGVVPHEVYRELYERSSLARLKLAGRVLGRAEVDCGGRLAFTYVEWRDFVATGAHPVDTENLVNECLKVDTAECAFIAVEQENRRIKFSLRARGDFDVSAIAEKFNGGGHQKASGAMLAGPVKEALERVRAAVREALGCESSEG
jgi:bifunctional oligoribonuclease and PAP phosphatase NrnA